MTFIYLFLQAFKPYQDVAQVSNLNSKLLKNMDDPMWKFFDQNPSVSLIEIQKRPKCYEDVVQVTSQLDLFSP